MKFNKNFKKKKNNNRIYGKANTYMYSKPKRYMTRMERDILWTALWLGFILCLALFFNSGAPLWLLLVWFLGLI